MTVRPGLLLGYRGRYLWADLILESNSRPGGNGGARQVDITTVKQPPDASPAAESERASKPPPM